MLAKMVVGQLRERPAMTALHVLLIALGTAALLLVSNLLQTVAQSSARDAKGIDLIVGPKGSPVQLVLAGVFHLDVPSGNIQLASLDRVVGRSPLVERVIPLSLGDSYSGARIVGTTSALIEHYGARFLAGGGWNAPMDVVIGSEVAANTQLQVGATFEATHGFDAQSANHAGHPMMVTGVLSPTGSVVDRLILTSLDTIWTAHGISNDPSKNETTMAIVAYKSPLAAATLPRLINATPDLQAASPALESARLMSIFGWIALILRAFAGLVVLVAGASLFSTLSHVLAHRMLDIAVVRALGARRIDVFKLLTFETMVIALLGVLIGFALSRAVGLGLNAWLPAQAKLGVSSPTSHEWMIAVGVIGFAFVCTIWPTIRAYRADAAALLTRGTI